MTLLTSNKIGIFFPPPSRSDYTTICTLFDNKKLDVLRRVAVEGNLKASNFRSVYWALFLEVFTEKSPEWKHQRCEQRFAYESLKQKYSMNPHLCERHLNDDNPLSQNQESVWNQHFCDQELLSVIQQDVIRTFPGVEFFRKANIQEIMSSILFTYARKFPEMVYRQGMHEVLAPIIFVVYSDQQALCHVKSTATELDPDIVYLLNPDYLEADCFELFTKVMDGIEQYYKINDIRPSASGHFPNVETSPVPENAKLSELEVIKQLNTIKDTILAKEDLHLHNHLLKLEIPLSLFGIRWLRLLFGREFPLHDLLVVWDAIFAEDQAFDLINYLCVAMLVRIREKLLYSDYTTTLTHLMKFPPNSDVSLIIRHALHIKSPKKYPRPANIFVFVTGKTPAPVRRPDGHGSPKKAALARSRSSLQSSRINGLQTHTAKQALTIAAASHNLDTEAGIVDGYLVDDPEVPKLELQHAYNIMSLSRVKLFEYVNVLRKNLPHNASDELYQAVDGIEEICSLLKPTQQCVFNVPAPVESALEADESPKKTQKKPASPIVEGGGAQQRLQLSQPPVVVSPGGGVAHKKEVEMKVIKIPNDFQISNLPTVDPVMERRCSF